MSIDLNEELILIPVTDEDTQTAVDEIAGTEGEDWDLIFLPNIGIVTKDTVEDVERLESLIKRALD